MTKLSRPIPADLASLFAVSGGVLTAAGLADAGVTRGSLRGELRRGTLVPLANGAYADAAELAGLSPWEAFRLRSLAFLAVSPDDAAASGWSTVAIRRLRCGVTPRGLPSVIRQRPGRSGSNRTPWGHTRFCGVPDEAIGTFDGVRVLQPAFAVCDLVRSAGRLSSLMVADAVAAEGDRTDLAEAAQLMRGWRGMPRARWLAQHADPAAETPLETAGRYAAIIGGLPVPRSNVWLGDGFPQYRVDHYWEEQAVAGEGDGAGKYQSDAAAVITKEKERHWQIDRWGVPIVRYNWTLAVRETPRLTARFADLLASVSGPVSGYLRWWPANEGWALIRREATLQDLPGRPARRRTEPFHQRTSLIADPLARSG